MKNKIIRLTEKDINKMVKSIITENEEVVNKILDKINDRGIESLDLHELELLKQYSTGNVDDRLRKFVDIESGYEFTSKNITGLVFEYSETEGYEDEVIHNGIIHYNDEVFYGTIYCTEEGEFMSAEFYAQEEITPETWEQTYDIYEMVEEDELNIFFEMEVCTYLWFNIDGDE
jgi:hypothetical protein